MPPRPLGTAGDSGRETLLTGVDSHTAGVVMFPLRFTNAECIYQLRCSEAAVVRGL